MTASIRVAAAALNQTPLDWDGNAARIRQAIDLARGEGVQLLCLPELCITGYGCEDAFQARGVVEMAWTVLRELLPATQDMLVALGLPVLFQDQRYNGAALAGDGRLLGVVGKQNLAGDGLHYEPRWFRPWPNNCDAMIAFEGRSVPLGDLIFDCGGVRIGFEICEDAWVFQRPGGELAAMGVDVILNPSASHFAFGKHMLRRRLVEEGSRAFRAAYVYANLLGNEAGRAIYDGDCFVATEGNLVIQGPRFGYRGASIASADVDLNRLRQSRGTAIRSLLGAANCGSRVVESPFTWRGPSASTRARSSLKCDTPYQPPSKMEEFTQAVALGLWDYLRKSHSRGFVVSLSGGADSSAVALLVSCMARLADRELGWQGLQASLPYIEAIQRATDVEQAIPYLLTCVYQATRNSSTTTLEAARTVATGLKARFLTLDVDPIVTAYVDQISQVIGRPLTWATDDIPLQNIQARARAPSAWLLANLAGSLLLSTSNRSEAAVGYATMDGDTAGGLAPIAGIDKAFLRHWLVWMESIGPATLGPFPFLNVVNSLEPTAELRPAAARQTDEADLMPYPVLDAIERAAIRDKLVPNECLTRLALEFSQYSEEQRIAWVQRFFDLWCRNQWKRERYAPSFHLDDENLDPKTWCRFPILSGGFVRELRELGES